MRVLVACEYSGRVRDAFISVGHEAVSCDLLPTDVPGPHYQGSVLDILNDGWDLMVGHPPCTYLTVTGNRWFKPQYESRYPTRKQDRIDAIEFFIAIANGSIPKIAIENPIGIMSKIYRKPDQIIQPFWFGHDARKSTCLWLKNLPLLKPTNIVEPRLLRYKDGTTVSADYMEGVKRSKAGESMKQRSVTYFGIARAMAEQWGTERTPSMPQEIGQKDNIEGVETHLTTAKAQNAAGKDC